MERKDRLNEILQYLGIAYSAFALKSGINPSNLKKMLDGSQTITDKTLFRIVNTFPELNIEWLRTGEGEMIKPTTSSIQSGNNNILQHGQAGHDLNQTNNSEKLFQDYIGGLKFQSKLTEKALEQQGKAMSQTDKAMSQTDKALEMMDRLITMLEKSHE